MTIEQENITVLKEEENIRIDKLLADRFKAKSRTYFQYLLDNKCVLINSKNIKKSYITKYNDEIEIFFQALPDISLQAENIPLNILYEDEHILAVNKPPGMVVHPAVGNWSGTFVNALLYHCKDLVCPDNDIRPGIVHRLDKDTSGVLLAAKTQIAHQKLITQFKQRVISKKYLTISHGKINNQIINAPIARHPIKRKEMSILDTGKEAQTDIKILAFKDNYSLILASPKTGRTHQIRVHLKHLNAPILGDAIYGSKSINNNLKIPRQLLHAYILEFSHPITNEPMKITAPIPDDLKKYITKLF